MKIRRRNLPLVLLLVPSFASAFPSPQDEALNVAYQARDATKLDPSPSPLIDTTKGKYDVGTKDAPVDGKDGKPHAGPFVGSEKDQKLTTVGEKSESVLGLKKDDLSDLAPTTGGKIPLPNDGVMDDPNRQLPKQGTTGTEGGVTEKDKVRQALGDTLGKKPDSPKEAPPLPLSEDTKTKNEKSKTKDDVDGADDEVDRLTGLEA